jgi:hypothetical protein
MTSQSGTTSAHTYGPKLVKLVVEGFKAMENNLGSAIKRGLFPNGTFLKEVLHKLSTVPPLLSNPQYVEFCELLAGELGKPEVSTEDLLAALWVIIENDCHESRLIPALTVDNSTGEVIVVLK